MYLWLQRPRFYIGMTCNEDRSTYLGHAVGASTLYGTVNGGRGDLQRSGKIARQQKRLCLEEVEARRRVVQERLSDLHAAAKMSLRWTGKTFPLS